MFTCQGLQTVPVYKEHDENIENNCKYHYCQNKGTGNATNKQPANEQTENVVNNVKMPFIDSINHIASMPTLLHHLGLVVRKPISANPRLNRPYPRNKFVLWLNSFP